MYRTLVLQDSVHLPDIAQVILTLECDCPVLHQPQYLVLYIVVETGHLQYRGQVVHKFPRGNLDQERIATVLNTCVCELWEGVRTRQKEEGLGRTPRAKSWTLGFL